ncbi:hypothetical protein LX36DRAFT_754674 [Colletotrichum falcatum]|nr:hypothetical protein LX36DRAFT_754674 [Colletotrichum falcatum]
MQAVTAEAEKLVCGVQVGAWNSRRDSEATRVGDTGTATETRDEVGNLDAQSKESHAVKAMDHGVDGSRRVEMARLPSTWSILRQDVGPVRKVLRDSAFVSPSVEGSCGEHMSAGGAPEIAEEGDASVQNRVMACTFRGCGHLSSTDPEWWKHRRIHVLKARAFRTKYSAGLTGTCPREIGPYVCQYKEPGATEICGRRYTAPSKFHLHQRDKHVRVVCVCRLCGENHDRRVDCGGCEDD